MNNSLTSRHFLISLAVHVAIILVCYLGPGDSVIHKKFLVLGAHSKKASHTAYKSMQAVPFVDPTKQQVTQPVVQKPIVQAKKIEEIPKVIEQKKAPEPKPKPTPKLKPTTLQKELPKKEIKPVAKKEPEPKKIVQAPKPIPAPIPVPVPVTAQQEQACPPELQVRKHEERRGEPIHLVYGDHQDEQARAYQKSIQRTISKLWQPPIGVPKGTECSLMFVVGKQGSVEKFELLQRSEILVYDLSIVRVAQQFKFHRHLWGKKFTVNFRQ